jgi:hypothetical protein
MIVSLYFKDKNNIENCEKNVLFIKILYLKPHNFFLLYGDHDLSDLEKLLVRLIFELVQDKRQLLLSS